MGLRTVKISTLENLALARLKELEPRLDSTVYGSIITNLIRSLAVEVHPMTYLAQDVLEDAFPQTAKGEALDNFGLLDNVERKQASQSVGYLSIFGTLGTVIPFGTEFTIDSVTIVTQNAVSVETANLSIQSISASNGVVTVTTAQPHFLARDTFATINTTDSRLNGLVKVVSLISNTVFKYEITDKNTLAPLTTGTVSITYGVVGVKSKDSGASQNILTSKKASGDYEAWLTFDGLTGGVEQESDVEYSARIIATRNLLEGVFTSPQVALAALSVEGNTRAWVVSPLDGVFGGVEGVIGYKPQPGQVCVYVARDNDSNPTASPAVLLETRDAIVADGKMPVHTVKEDIFVFSPVFIPQNFTISGLVPATDSLKLAIEAELSAYIQDFIGFEEGFGMNQQISVVQNTRDAVGNTPTSFTITSGVLFPPSGGLLTMGVVTWV